jgi:Heterokaryon incompatibility protein (HET)
MGKIYAGATAALVWLGPAADGSSETVDLLNAVVDGMDRPSLTLLYPELILQKDLPCLWILLSKLAQRPYWKRLWIIQEVVLARKITVHCGDRQLSWESLTRPYAGFISSVDVGLASDVTANAAQARLKMEHNPINQLSWQRTYGEKRDLEHLLRAHGHNQCVDTRDRVYDLLGLQNLSFSIDYSVDTVTLFFRVIAFCKLRECLDFAKMSVGNAPEFGRNLTAITSRRFCKLESSPGRK